MWIQLLFLIVIAYSEAQETAVETCINNEGPLPLHTYVNGCTTPPCQLHNNKDLSINLDFIAPYHIKDIRTLVTGYFDIGSLSVPVKYDLHEQESPCRYLRNPTCPIEAGTHVNYTLNKYFEAQLPGNARLAVELRMVDENNVPVVCSRFNAVIADQLTLKQLLPDIYAF